MTKHTGRCLCGEVKYEVAGSLRQVSYCHCEQCCRTSGHFVAATACDPDHLVVTVKRGLRWYQSSSTACRGFCANCGSSIFWRPEHGEYISIMAGTLDRPVGLTAKEHILVGNGGAYYTIDDGLPQYANFATGGMAK